MVTMDEIILLADDVFSEPETLKMKIIVSAISMNSLDVKVTLWSIKNNFQQFRIDAKWLVQDKNVWFF